MTQDERERKGSFFTPKIWTKLSQKYIADALGEDWQDEYYVWDCAAGTGNLLAGLTSIGKSAFGRCTELTSISLPDGLTTIEAGAFVKCTGLRSITVDPGNRAYTSVDGVLFDKAGKTLVAYPAGKAGKTYTLPAGLTAIGNVAFYECAGLTSITFPAGLTAIGNEAFSGCTGLMNISFPAGLTTIRERAFSGCTGLTSITLPAGLTSIESGAFTGCTGLKDVVLSRKTRNVYFPTGVRLTYID